MKHEQIAWNIGQHGSQRGNVVIINSLNQNAQHKQDTGNVVIGQFPMEQYTANRCSCFWAHIQLGFYNNGIHVIHTNQHDFNQASHNNIMQS